MQDGNSRQIQILYNHPIFPGEITFEEFCILQITSFDDSLT